MRRVTPALALIALAIGACSSEATDTGYQLVEFSIDGPNGLPAGEGNLTVVNSGQYSHTLVITDAQGHVVVASPLIPAGETLELPVELETGLYSFTCRIVAQDGEGNIVDHYEAGMSTVVEVSA